MARRDSESALDLRDANKKQIIENYGNFVSRRKTVGFSSFDQRQIAEYNTEHDLRNIRISSHGVIGSLSR